MESPLGAVGVVWGETAAGPRVIRVLLPAGRCPEAREEAPREIRRAAKALAAMLKGGAAEIPLEAAALETCSPFRRAVYREAYRIPRGAVVSYGELAQRLGRPGAARAVGNALAANPFPLIVPCHRVVRSDGALGGFTGGTELKRRLLELEGARFSGSRVTQAFLPVRLAGTDRNVCYRLR